MKLPSQSIFALLSHLSSKRSQSLEQKYKADYCIYVVKVHSVCPLHFQSPKLASAKACALPFQHYKFAVGCARE